MGRLLERRPEAMTYTVHKLTVPNRLHILTRRQLHMHKIILLGMLHQALVIHQDISIETILSNSGIGQILQENPTCAPSLHEAKNTHSRFHIFSFSLERDMMRDSYSLHSLMSSFAALDASFDNICTANFFRIEK